MNYFFTSDTHFGHFNIIEYCGRPFKTLKEMDKTLIKNWNERVKSEDLVFELGDFNFHNSPGGKSGEGILTKVITYENQLNGNIIHIRGNHSSNNGCKTPIENMVIKLGGYRINLVHNPEWINVNYDINFCGHVHQNWEIKRIRKGYSFTDVINVSCDVWDFRPVTINEILQRYSKWKKDNHYN